MTNIIIVIVGLVIGSLLTVPGIIRARRQTRWYREQADRLEAEFKRRS